MNWELNKVSLCQKIISKYCEMVKLCRVNHSGPVFLRQCIWKLFDRFNKCTSKKAYQVSKKRRVLNRHMRLTYCIVSRCPVVRRARGVVKFQNVTQVLTQLSAVLQVYNRHSSEITKRRAGSTSWLPVWLSSKVLITINVVIMYQGPDFRKILGRS